MAAERVIIQITGDTTSINSTISELEKLGKVDIKNRRIFDENNRRFNENLNKTKDNLGVFGDQLNSLKQQVIGAFAVTSIVAFGKEAVATAAKIESIGNSLKFITGSSANAEKTMTYLRELSNRLGLEFESTAQAFKLFAGATTQAGMTLGQTKSIFESVSKAVTTMGLSADDANGVFLALSQIMSKGKVSAEELRGQIGERIPGAFSIAAKSIGVTEQQLNKMLEQGQILSKDFLPKFAKQLETDLGGGAERAANSTQAALNRLKNSFDEFLLFIGQKLAPGVKLLSKVFEGLTYAMRGEAGQREADSRQQGVEYAKEIIKELEKVDDLNLRSDQALDKRNFYYKRLYQTQEEINKLLAEREKLLNQPRKAGTAISGRLNDINKEAEALAGNKYMYEEIINSLKEYDTALSSQNETLNQNTDKTNKSTKSKEKELNEYEKLIKAAKDTEEALQVLYASGAVTNTPMEKKLHDLLSQIEMINDRIEMAKNGMQTMTLTSGTEQGGTPKAFTTAITAFGSVEENKIATEDIIKNAEKANEEFARIEEERTRKFQEEQDKRKAAEEAFYNQLPQFASQAISIISQYQQQSTDYELQLLDQKLKARQISDKEYEKERRRLLTKQAQDQKAAAILQATIDIAGSIMSTLKQFGGTPYGIAMAAVTAGLGAAQLAVIQSQKIPKFKKGTDYVSLNGNPKGEDTIPALLNEGEAIITTEQNAKYPGLAKAWNDGKLDEHIYTKWMTPELILKKSLEREAIDYDRLGQSVADSIKKNPQVKVSFDKSGFATYIIKGNSVINYQNNRYSSK